MNKSGATFPETAVHPRVNPAGSGEGNPPAGQGSSPGITEVVRRAVEARIRQEQPLLASLPPTQLQLHRLTTDPRASLADVKKLVSQDPPLAGRLMELANSAFYQRSKAARSLDDALLRLGLGAVRNLLLLPFMKARLLRGPAAEQLWTHSVATAAVAPFVAALAGMGADQAFLAGLLHDVGRVALWLDAQGTVLDLNPEFPAVVEELHADIGGQMLRRWHMDEEVVQAVAFHRIPPQEAPRLAHVVHIAERAAHTLDPQPVPYDPLRDPAVGWLGVSVEAVRSVVLKAPLMVRAMRL